MNYILDELKQFGMTLCNNLEFDKNYIYTNHDEQYIIFFTNTKNNVMLKKSGKYFGLDCTNFNHNNIFDIFYNYCLNCNNLLNKVYHTCINMKICKSINSSYIIYINHVNYFYNNNVMLLNSNFDKYYNFIETLCCDNDNEIYYSICYKY